MPARSSHARRYTIIRDGYRLTPLRDVAGKDACAPVTSEITPMSEIDKRLTPLRDVAGKDACAPVASATVCYTSVATSPHIAIG